MIVRRGYVVLVDLGPYIGSERSGVRPCVVVQNNVANKYANTTVIVPLTDARSYRQLPTQAFLPRRTNQVLSKDSVACADHIRVIDKEQRIHAVLGQLSESSMLKIERAILGMLGMQGDAIERTD